MPFTPLCRFGRLAGSVRSQSSVTDGETGETTTSVVCVAPNPGEEHPGSVSVSLALNGCVVLLHAGSKGCSSCKQSSPWWGALGWR